MKKSGGQAKRQFIAMVLEARTVLEDRGLQPEFSYPVTRNDFDMYQRVMQSCLKRKVYPTKSPRKETKQLSCGKQASSASSQSQAASTSSVSAAQYGTAALLPVSNSLSFHDRAEAQPDSSRSSAPGSDMTAETASLPISREMQQGSDAPGISTSSASTTSTEGTSGKSTGSLKTGNSNVVKRLQEANRPKFTSGLSTTVKAKSSGPVSATKILKKAKDTHLSRLASKRALIVDTVPRLLPPLAASRLRRKLPRGETIVLPRLPFPAGMDFLPLEVKTEQEENGNGAITQEKASDQRRSPVDPLSIILVQPKSEVISPVSEPSVEGLVNARDSRSDLDGSKSPPPPVQRDPSQESLLAGGPLEMDLDTEESSQEQLSPPPLVDATPPRSATAHRPSSDSLRPVDSTLSAVAASVPRFTTLQPKRIVSSFVTALPTATSTAPVSRTLTKFLEDTSLVLASVGDSERNAQQRQKVPIPGTAGTSNSSTVGISDQAKQSNTSSSSVLPQSSINAMIEKVLQDLRSHIPIPDPAPPSKPGPDTATPVSTSPGSKKRKSTVPKRIAVATDKTSTDEKTGKTKNGSKSGSKIPDASLLKKRGAKVTESGPQKRKRSADSGVPADSGTPPEDLAASGGSVQDSLRQRVFTEARKLQALGCPLPHQKQNKKISQNQITSLGQRPRKMSESDAGNPSSPSSAAASTPLLSPGRGSSASGELRVNRRQSSSSSVDDKAPSPTETRNTIIVTVAESFNPDIIHQNPIVTVANSAVLKSSRSIQSSKSSTDESRPASAKKQKTAASRRRRSSVQSGGPQSSSQEVRKSTPAATVSATPVQSGASSKPSRPDSLPTGAREGLQRTSSEPVRSPLLHSRTSSLSSAPPVKIEPIRYCNSRVY